MRLISCYIDNFGLLSDVKLDFNSGLNSFCSENSTGKTTLSVFIKAMLYGFTDNRVKNDENERKKYNPWQGGRYGGSLTFEAGGKRYIAERTFGGNVRGDKFLLRDEKTGGVSNYYTENLGEELFGINREGFVRTVFLSEKSIAPSDRITPSVASKLSDIMGADGDVGSCDGALDLLDERRKFYQKRGGGEIERITAEIAECDRQLDELDRIRASAEGVKDELSKVDGALTELKNERDRLSGRLEKLSGIRERRSYRENYARMRDELQEHKSKLSELGDFFHGVIPSYDEIEAAARAKTEASLILRELELDPANDELIRLAEFFAPGTSLSEIDTVDRAERQLAEDEVRLSAILAGSDERSAEMRELFPAKVPTEAELEENIGKAKSSGGSMPTVIAVIGLLIIAVGIGLGLYSKALFSICVVGVVLTTVGLIIKIGVKGGLKREVIAFIREVCPTFDGDILGKLYELKKDLERYGRLEETRTVEHSELVSKVERGRDTVIGFLRRFGLSGADRAAELRRIKSDYQRYTALDITAGSRTDRLGRAKSLNAEAAEFIRRFPTVSADPIEEIRTKVSDYKFHAKQVEELEEKCKKFADEYGITDTEEIYDEGEVIRINERISEIDESIRAKTRDKTILSQQLNDMRNRIETAEDIKAARADASERLAEARRSLSVIQTAKSLIEEAYQRMTERYTGRTQERFVHYVKMINGEGGEFRLDTNFEITRIERGAAHEEEAYSRGTKDLYSLAMRLALTDSLYEGELPFLVLDDPFISLDDKRCERAKAMLKSIAKERQIIYFTCSDSRAIK